MKSETNILEIPSRTLGSIIVPTQFIPGTLNSMVNLFTFSSSLFVGMIVTSSAKKEDRIKI
jgi:hypothetical protein